MLAPSGRHALVAVFLACMLARPAQTSAATGTSADRAALEQALTVDAQRLDDAARTARAHHVPTMVPRITLPQADNAKAAPVSLDRWLQSELARIAKERNPQAQARDLRDLAASLRRAGAGADEPPPPVDAHELATQILSQTAYAHEAGGPAPSPQPTLLEKALKWLGERIQKLLQALLGAAVAAPAIGRAIVAAFIVALAAVTAYLIYLLALVWLRRERKQQPNAGTPLPAAIHPQMLYERANAAAAAAQYGQAVALLFQASLRIFDGSGKLPYDPSLTPGEYRRAVRRSIAGASSLFDEIARAFVLAAFAGHPTTHEEFASADQAYRAMRQLVTA